MRNTTKILLTCLVLALTGSAYGQMSYTATGGDAQVQEMLSTVDLPNGNMLSQVAGHGFIWTNEENIVGGNGSWECRGSLVMSPEGDPLDGAGSCDGMDGDGDVFWISWRGGLGGDFNFLGGTGKYTGINGGGTWKTVAQYPDGKANSEWQGTWTIPAAEMGME